MLITVEDLQKFTGVYPEETESQQELFIGSAEDIVTDYLRFDPNLKEYDLFLNGSGKNELYLPAKPITEIDSVLIDGAEYDSNLFGFEDNVLFFRNYKNSFPSGTRNIEIKFKAGFKIIPSIIKLTVLRIAGILQTENSGNIGITSKSFQDSGSRTFVNTTDFSKYLLQISDYRIF